MDDHPIRDERILDELEACRPCCDAASDPALARVAAAMAVDRRLEELRERIERLDIKLATAFHDVPIPEGLADRLQERLAAARLRQDATAGTSSNAKGSQGATAGLASSTNGWRCHGGRVVIPYEQDARRPHLVLLRRVSRRWLLAGVVPVCAAIALLVAVWIGLHHRNAYTRSMVLEQAIVFFSEESAAPGSIAPAPPAYPLSRDVAAGTDMRWRPIGGFLGREGVAYDLSRPGEPRATLYVVRCTVQNLPSEPPVRPAFTTANCSTSAWQDGELLYVLVVDGGRDAYRSRLELARGPMA